MNNKMKLGIAMMMLTTSLSLVLLSTPSKVAMAQISPENQTMIQHPKKDYYNGIRNNSNRYNSIKDEIDQIIHA